MIPPPQTSAGKDANGNGNPIRQSNGSDKNTNSNVNKRIAKSTTTTTTTREKFSKLIDENKIPNVSSFENKIHTDNINLIRSPTRKIKCITCVNNANNFKNNQNIIRGSDSDNTNIRNVRKRSVGLQKFLKLQKLNTTIVSDIAAVNDADAVGVVVVSHEKNQINQALTLLQMTADTTPATTIKPVPTTNDYILITDYDELQPKTFWQKYGLILSISAGITFCGAAISIFIAVIYCARAAALTRHASVALALPIPLLPEDQTPLHAEPEHPVPMLSVQTAGCAGMERLGVPARTSLNTPPDDRAQFSRRMRVEALQARELLAVRNSSGAETVIRSNNNHNSSSSSTSNHHHHHHQHHQRTSSLAASNNTSGGCALIGSNSINRTGGNTQQSTPTATSINNSNIARGGIEATTLKYGNTGSGSGHSSSGSSCGSIASSVNSHSHDHHQHYQHGLQQQQTLRCPHHVPLPDSEWGQDRDLQIRTRYQQSEITRSYIKPPPNKTIKDVPEQSSYNFFAIAAQQAMPSAATPSQFYYASQQHHLQQQQQQQQHHSSSYNQQHSASSSTLAAAASTSLLTTATGGAAVACSTSTKSKPNVITKLFSRKSSPKSPTALTTSSTCSSLTSSASLSSMPSAASSASSLGSSSSSVSAASVSTSSSASSLSSAQSLPISTAAALTTTACNYGASNTTTPPPPFFLSGGNNIIGGLAPTTQLLTTIGVPSVTTTTTATGTTGGGRLTPPQQTLVRIPTPPLSVCVPISYQQQQYNKQFQQQQQQLLLDSIVAESATSTASLQSLKSSSCSLSSSPLGGAVVSMDCCPQVTTPKKRHQSPTDTMRSAAANETQMTMTSTTGNIRRNSSNCSMNCCNTCGCIIGVECNNCNNSTTSRQQQQQQQQQQDDQQHAL